MRVKQARTTARAALEKYFYTDVCSVVEYRDAQDPQTKLTCKQEVVILKNQPCKLSFQTVRSAENTDTAAAISQNVKLFLAPEIEILPGSKIIVTHEGRDMIYSQSGVSAAYPTHQEIALVLFEERA